jgi:hypothetical protein
VSGAAIPSLAITLERRRIQLQAPMMVLRKWAHCLPAFRSVGPPFLRRLRSAGAFSGRNYMRSTATLISGLCLIFATAVAGQENSPTIAQS